jgi:hypothetical protein
MPSFREVSRRFPALLIDAASSEIQVGILRENCGRGLVQQHRRAGVAVFQGVKELGLEPA